MVGGKPRNLRPRQQISRPIFKTNTSLIQVYNVTFRWYSFVDNYIPSASKEPAWAGDWCQAGFSLADFLYPEDRGDKFFRNVGLHNIYTAPYPRRRNSSKTPPCKPQVLHSSCLLGYNVVYCVKCQPTLQKNMLPLSSGSACQLFHADSLFGLFFYPKDRGGMFLPSVRWLTKDYMTLYPRI
jgi:hypothetical protein